VTADRPGGRGAGAGLVGDRGSATVPVLAVGLVTVLVALVVAAAGAAMAARHRAQLAADAAALAGAARAVEGEQNACAAAAAIATANGAELVHCGLDGWDAVVTVAVRPPTVATAFGRAVASARAGPTTFAGDRPLRFASPGSQRLRSPRA
jgi:secretion/DNA translocation related TadE-like protein